MISRLKTEMICAMSGYLTEYDINDRSIPLHFSAVIHINVRIVIIYISFNLASKT